MEEFNALKTIMEGGFVIGALFLIYLIIRVLYVQQKKKNGNPDRNGNKDKIIICPLNQEGAIKNIGELVLAVAKVEKDTKEVGIFIESKADVFEKSHIDIHRKMEALHETDIRSSEILTQILKEIEK